VRVALLSYRSKPFCGGQGVYVRHLARALTDIGHSVEVLSGPPYPILDDDIAFTALPSLDLYREPDPFRLPHPREFRTPIDALEFALMCTAAFPEPLTFTLRAWRHLRDRVDDFDVVHDNQSLGYGLLGIERLGLPVVATVHHPVTVDRRFELAAASWRRSFSLRRWYAFTRMQGRVVRRLPQLATVSSAAYDDIVAEFAVDPRRLRVIPNGVDSDVFAPPAADAARVPGRVVATASADVPLKGLVPLLEAIAKLRTERDAELVLVGKPKTGGVADATLDRLGLRDCVRWVNGLTDAALAQLLGSAEVAVVPSLYEGFSLPAIEAMACGTALVATTAGALPEVVGPDGVAAMHVPPGDPDALALAIGRVLGDPTLRTLLGDGGRQRVLDNYTWRATAQATADMYVDAIAARQAGTAAC
jgi:glycosyltransferase involved in cell wall biosynthesis